MKCIALLTDFGTRDWYAGTMKGVILSICPEAKIVDITHDIPAGDIQSGAYSLMASYKYFPKGTILLILPKAKPLKQLDHLKNKLPIFPQ